MLHVKCFGNGFVYFNMCQVIILVRLLSPKRSLSNMKSGFTELSVSIISFSRLGGRNIISSFWFQSFVSNIWELDLVMSAYDDACGDVVMVTNCIPVLGVTKGGLVWSTPVGDTYPSIPVAIVVVVADRSVHLDKITTISEMSEIVLISGFYISKNTFLVDLCSSLFSAINL